MVCRQLQRVVAGHVLEPEARAGHAEHQIGVIAAAHEPQLLAAREVVDEPRETRGALGRALPQQEARGRRRRREGVRRRGPVGRRLMRVLLRVVVPREVRREHRRHERAGQDGRNARRAQQHEHGQSGQGGNHIRPVHEDSRVDRERDPERERGDQPRRGARAGLAERDPGQRRESEREERQRPHGLVLGDRAQGIDRICQDAGQPGRPGDGENREHEREPGRLPAAHERVQRQRGRERACVERRELGAVRPEPAEQHARVGPRDAVAHRVDHAVGRGGAADQLEPWQQRDGGDAQRRRSGAGEDRKPAQAQLQHQHDEGRGGSDCRQLLRAREQRERERERQHDRRGTAPFAPRGELGRGDAGCQPGRACQQPEGLRAREQVARDAEGEPRVDRSEAARAEQARERVGGERRQQVVEADQQHQAGRGGEQAVGGERRRVEHAGLRIGRERLPRERERVPERQVAVAQAIVQEGREGRVEGVRVVPVRQPVSQRQRRQHERRHQRDGGDRGEFAGAWAGGKAHARERCLDGRGPANEFRGRTHPPRG